MTDWVRGGGGGRVKDTAQGSGMGIWAEAQDGAARGGAGLE